MKRPNFRFPLILSAIVFAIALCSCSGQSEVNSFITSMDNYAQSIDNATSMQEIGELDRQYAVNASKYIDSDVKLTDADREAIMTAIMNLSQKVNQKIGEFRGIDMNLPDSVLEARASEFRAGINRCTTLGEVVKMGL